MEPHMKPLPLLEEPSGCSCCGPTRTSARTTYPPFATSKTADPRRPA